MGMWPIFLMVCIFWRLIERGSNLRNNKVKADTFAKFYSGMNGLLLKKLGTIC